MITLPWRLVDRTDSCWVWQGQTVKRYGKYAGRVVHRRFYEVLVGPIPTGLEIDHLCRNTLCVNPLHLEPVTRAENARRRNVLYTHCRHGHEFTPTNTCLDRVGHRSCRTCRTECKRRSVAKKRAGTP